MMTGMDTHTIVKNLIASGFTSEQSEKLAELYSQSTDTATKNINNHYLSQKDFLEHKNKSDERINTFKSELKDDIHNVRNELKDDIGKVRTELKDDINKVRTELSSEILTLRIDLEKYRAEMTRWFLATTLSIIGTTLGVGVAIFFKLS